MVQDDFLSVIDAGAKALLERATEVDKDGQKGPDLAERVKAFEAVAKWAETRAKIAPPQKREAKFDGIRDRFRNGDGRARGRRGNAGAGEEDAATATEQ